MDAKNSTATRLPAGAYAGPDRIDQALGLAALALLAAVAVAVLRGRADWPVIPPLIWLHLFSVAVSLALTPLVLWRRRGDGRHRRLGYVWVGALVLASVSSLGIREINDGQLSWIHFLTLFTLTMLVRMVAAARRKDHVQHRAAIRGLVLGALLIAGFFTFPFNRLLGQWLLGT
jgi:uncharacterized membrane protein